MGKLYAFTAANIPELLFVFGLVLLTGGCALVSFPAALIVPGVALIWLAFWLATPTKEP